MRGIVMGCVLALGLGLSSPEARAAGWPDTTLNRVSLQALVETLAARLLSEHSATLTLESWCEAHHLAQPASIVAQMEPGVLHPISEADRALLGVGSAEPVRYRRVALSCGGKVLSRAENWYVPSRLTPAMNQLLDTSTTPFGKVVAPLHFSRHTLESALLWSPLPQGWENHALPQAHDGRIAVPEEILRNRAVLQRADGAPFSLVVETYSGAMLDFPPPG